MRREDKIQKRKGARSSDDAKRRAKPEGTSTSDNAQALVDASVSDEERRAKRGGAVVRLPLEVGISALNDFALGILALPIGLAIIGGLVWFIVWSEADPGDLGGYVAAAGGTIAIFGVTRVRRAWRCRPADVVLEANAVRVDGGANHALEVPFADINWSRCDVVPILEDGKVDAHKLVVGDVQLGEADDDDEVGSLRQVMDAIRYRAGMPLKDESDAARTASAAILSCPTCGSPVAPSAAESSECGHCQAMVPMSKDVRERVRAAAELPKREQRAAKLVDKLLDQPGATSTTIFLALSSSLIAAAWPVTVWAYVHLYRLQRLDFVSGALLAFLPLLLVADGFFLSRLRLVDRRALGSMIMTFAARPPSKPGDPLGCRSCLAPLPKEPQTVVKCVYCGAANLTGLDLRSHESRAAESEASLMDAIDDRTRQRNTWRLRTLLSIPAFVVTVVLLRQVFS